MWGMTNQDIPPRTRVTAYKVRRGDISTSQKLVLCWSYSAQGCTNTTVQRTWLGFKGVIKADASITEKLHLQQVLSSDPNTLQTHPNALQPCTICDALPY